MRWRNFTHLGSAPSAEDRKEIPKNSNSETLNYGDMVTGRLILRTQLQHQI